MSASSSGSGRPREEKEKAQPPDLHRWKLPRGRHGLPRELVAQSQRERLIAAVVRTSAAQGYQSTSVADILKAAGVGRESFYRQFKDKEDCFIAANETLVDRLDARVDEACEGQGPWPEQVRRALAATLFWLASDPDVARVMIVEIGIVGPIAGDRFRSTFGRLIAILEDGAELVEGAPKLPNIASIAGGAVFARVYEEVVHGNATELPRLVPQLTFELLLPYIGEDAAREEQSKAAEETGEP
jgi:AcrR family transcriptional regulator